MWKAFMSTLGKGTSLDMTAPTAAPLYHYTCHPGRAAIGTAGTATPLLRHNTRAAASYAREHDWLATVTWFTDLTDPHPEALGFALTDISLPPPPGLWCDKLTFRYRTAVGTPALCRWLRVAPKIAPAADIARLNTAAGAQPDHWFVSVHAVRVVLDDTYPGPPAHRVCAAWAAR